MIEDDYTRSSCFSTVFDLNLNFDVAHFSVHQLVVDFQDQM
jgi:hypothetical protein